MYCENLISSDFIKVRRKIRCCSGSSSNLNFKTFNLYAVLSKFDVNFAHNFDWVPFLIVLTFIASLYSMITFVGRIIFTRLQAWQVLFHAIPVTFAFLWSLLTFDFLYLLSSDESDSLNDESDELSSDSVSSGMYYFCDFPLRFDDSNGSVSVLGYVAFAITRFNTKGNIFLFDVFVTTGVESKVGRLIKMSWRSNSLFSFQIWISV